MAFYTSYTKASIMSVRSNLLVLIPFFFALPLFCNSLICHGQDLGSSVNQFYESSKSGNWNPSAMDSNYRSSFQTHVDTMISNTSQAFKKAGGSVAESQPKQGTKGSENKKSQTPVKRDEDSHSLGKSRIVRQGSEPDTGMKSGVSEAGAQEVRFGNPTPSKPSN
jgi:hypothetical protein